MPKAFFAIQNDINCRMKTNFQRKRYSWTKNLTLILACRTTINVCKCRATLDPGWFPKDQKKTMDGRSLSMYDWNCFCLFEVLLLFGRQPCAYSTEAVVWCLIAQVAEIPLGIWNDWERIECGEWNDWVFSRTTFKDIWKYNFHNIHCYTGYTLISTQIPKTQEFKSNPSYWIPFCTCCMLFHPCFYPYHKIHHSLTTASLFGEVAQANPVGYGYSRNSYKLFNRSLLWW